MAVTAYAHGITAIDTGFTRPNFDAAHLIEDGGEFAFVDTGTSFSVPALLAALADQGAAPEQVRYVLLTHVHLDHAGGAGTLMRRLPNATAVLHPRGARHMIDPTRLIAGSTAVYGEETVRRVYGDIAPIAQARIRTCADGEVLELGGRALALIHTEGHARHHYCIVDETAQAVFSGDTFGVSYREFDGPAGALIFPAATPTEFDPDAMHASIDRLVAFRPEAVYLTHYSRVTGAARLADQLHRDIDAFVAMAERCAGAEHRTQTLRAELAEYLASRVRAHGTALPEATWRDLLAIDIELDVQGLEVWLERTGRAAG